MYYDSNAEEYYNSTVNADLTDCYERFLKYVKDGAHILDAGCGSGRDSKFFLSKGYSITAIDGSAELCILAEKNIGQPVYCMNFLDLKYENDFDAVWACASLLHVDENNIDEVVNKLHRSLKEGGVLYASFKYGNGSRIDNNQRYFYDLNEERIAYLFNRFEIKEMWDSNDVRPGRTEKWINIIVEKKINIK